MAATSDSTAGSEGNGGSRGRLLDAAVDLFGRRGYGDTTVSEIAREAGVSKGLVYHYFDTKRDLLAAVIRRGERRLEGLLARHDPDEGIAALPAVVMGSLGLVAEDLAYWRLRFALRMRPDLRAELGLTRWSRSLEEVLRRCLEASGVDRPSAEARVLGAAVDGAAQHYVLDPDRYPLAEVAERLVARYLSGR